jgi:dTDP-4-amino-4,6-dideoxy-D-galactose acyltransferase
MIKLLEWDTNFFGYKIGEINEVPDESLAKYQGYKLLYARSTPKKPLIINSFMDHKVQFVKSVEPVLFDQTLLTQAGNELFPWLLDLALLSGNYSRFKLDTNFKAGEFERLYQEWIEKSLSRALVDEVIQFEEKGFVTIKKKGLEAHIGLIAVSEKFQGLGIGKTLLKAAENFALKNGLNTLHVPTQKININACSFYERYGFQVEFEELTHHIWIK